MNYEIIINNLNMNINKELVPNYYIKPPIGISLFLYLKKKIDKKSHN